MDMNFIILWGQLSTDPELRVFDSGTRLIRYLITVRADYPKRRVDVIPVTLWDPPDHIVDSPGVKGKRVWVCGSLQRRYWESPDGRRSRIEVVADQVKVREEDEEELESESSD